LKPLGDKLLDGAKIEWVEGFDWHGIGAQGVGTDDEQGFSIALNPQSLRNKNFQLAATFADYLLADKSDIFLATSVWTDRQKINRAFAAEILAPIDAIRAIVNNRRPPIDNLAAVVDEFNVSRRLVRYQIENQAPELLPLVA
jgi:Zn-dependent peptidase ImmA (M78 family)